MRSSRTAHRAALVTATLALGVGLAGPASAAVEKHTDPTKDVTRISFEDGDSTRPAKSNKTYDITRFTTQHGKKTVTITTTLRKVSRDGTLFTHFIRTPDSTFAANGRFADGRGEVEVYDERDTRAKRAFAVAGEQNPCPRARVKVQAKKDRFAVVIPRSCLDGPAWVRTGGAVGNLTETGSILDDARRKGFDDADGPKLGKKKVRRG